MASDPQRMPGAVVSSRYELLVKIAAGGMATVYVGRLRGALGFEQLVAVKRPHEHLLQEPSFRQSLLKEAQLASLIRHANVVSVRDIEVEANAILLVMDYVEGGTLQEMLQHASSDDPEAMARDQSWVPVGLRIVLDACAGLAAVHDLTDGDGRPLGMVHRDVSPHNILVGVDGVSRLTDFGIAKCLRADEQATQEGIVKGKLAYMAPEYMLGRGVDQRADIFAIGVVLWEVLTRRRLFRGENDMEVLGRILQAPIPLVSEYAPSLGTRFDAVAARALARNPLERFGTMHELIEAVEYVIGGARYLARAKDVGQFVNKNIGDELARRRENVREALRTGARPPELAVADDGSAQIRRPADGAAAMMTAAPQGYDNSWIGPIPGTEPGQPAAPVKEPWYAKISVTARIILAFLLVVVLGGALGIWMASSPAPKTAAPQIGWEQQTNGPGAPTGKRPQTNPAASASALMEQMRTMAATDPDGAKRRLQARLLSGRATPEEIALLRNLCRDRPDQICSDQARRLRGDE